MIKQLLKTILGRQGLLWTHRVRGRLAAALYGYPGRKLRVIGVTGTNGKTTTCFMIAHILSAARYRVGMATTVEFRINEKRMVNTTKMTTISPFALQRLLREMVKAGCQFAVLEVTSHAIAQERIFGIPFDAVAITNVTHDHLDYHRTFEEYRDTKVRLFAGSPRLAVVNIDDKSAPHFLALPAELKLTYGVEGEAQVKALRIRHTPLGIEMRIRVPGGAESRLTLPLPGLFNVYNALAATSVTIGCGVKLSTIVDALATFPGVPGRMERIEAGQPFTVLVDYAHTPDAFRQIYATLRPATTGRIIHVFGATGDRDKTKRPILGAIAAQYADYIILTDEDPYSEDPAAIIEAVADGVVRAARRHRKTEGKDFWKILDRREAIAKALSLARAGDVVLVTGKGAEQAMVVGDKKVPWDDRQVVHEELARLGLS
jgi:UDP-N-acetylmuramoyl-L-alanyl-D-glutamate--2,6-diaminopimelate ligase